MNATADNRDSTPPFEPQEPIVSSIASALSSAAAPLVRDLKTAIPTALALSAAGLSPIASAAVGLAAGELTGTTASFSDLGKQLAGLGTSVVDGAENVVSSVATPVLFGLGAIVNAVA